MKTSNFKAQTPNKFQISNLKHLVFGVWCLNFATCALNVDCLRKIHVQLADFSTAYTGCLKYLTSQVFFILSLYTRLGQLAGAYKQEIPSVSNLLNDYLCPVYTGPITNTNLNKE